VHIDQVAFADTDIDTVLGVEERQDGRDQDAGRAADSAVRTCILVDTVAGFEEGSLRRGINQRSEFLK
jgi:hypothetical protein